MSNDVYAVFHPLHVTRLNNEFANFIAKGNISICYRDSFQNFIAYWSLPIKGHILTSSYFHWQCVTFSLEIGGISPDLYSIMSSCLHIYATNFTGRNTKWSCSILWDHFLVPYRLAGGTLSLLAVCLSVRPSVCLSVCPSHFGFPAFSLPSFKILTWNLIYEFVMTWYRSSLSFVKLDLLLQELLPFVKN